MSRRWAVATMVASTLLGVASLLSLVVDQPAGAGTLAPLTGPEALAGPEPVGAPDVPLRTRSPQVDPGNAGPGRLDAAAPSTDAPGTDAAATGAGGAGPVIDGPVTIRPARVGALDSDPDAPVPVRLELPDTGIEAAVDPVGVESDGSMTVPDDVLRLGWYRYGSVPGDAVGSAVIAGHVDSRAQGPGAFFALADVEPGDRVAVEMSDGSTVRYEVVGRDRIGKAALPTDDIFRRTGPGVLTLVTCGGDFDPDQRSYADNVVVVAVEVA